MKFTLPEMVVADKDFMKRLMERRKDNKNLSSAVSKSKLRNRVEYASGR